MPRSRTKAAAKRNEETDITALITYINTADSPIGNALRQKFSEIIGKPLLEAAHVPPLTEGIIHNQTALPGSRHAHYDFVVRTTDNVWLKVEHKGSAVRAPIDPSRKPWVQGVQFYNGGMEKYRFAVRYATAWYNKYVGSGLLKERYNIRALIPTLTEWLNNDAKTQGDPKTPFGRELKATVRAATGSSLLAERNEFVEEFLTTCSADDEATLAADMLPLIREAFAQKDVWLQVAGDVATGEFDFLWRPQLTINGIESVRFFQSPKKTDICMEVQCGDGLCLKPILRWGKGAGFSNLRLDLK